MNTHCCRKCCCGPTVTHRLRGKSLWLKHNRHVQSIERHKLSVYKFIKKLFVLCVFFLSNNLFIVYYFNSYRMLSVIMDL